MLEVGDKIGGASLCRIKDFKSCVDTNSLLDLRYVGLKFTWTNKKTLEGIDRGICNMVWRNLFPEACVFHLPRTKSDHCPLKISLQSTYVPNPL